MHCKELSRTDLFQKLIYDLEHAQPRVRKNARCTMSVKHVMCQSYFPLGHGAFTLRLITDCGSCEVYSLLWNLSFAYKWGFIRKVYLMSVLFLEETFLS